MLYREIGGMNDDRRAVEVTAFSTAFSQKAFSSKKRISASESAGTAASGAAFVTAKRSASASPTAAKTAVRALIAAAVFLIGFAAVFACGDAVKSGISAGIELCLGVLVPSLFLPLVLCAFLQCSGAAAWFGRALTRLPFQFFRREGMSLCIFMISLVSGYPAGAFLSRAMYDAGEIDRETARRLPLCCVCAGPAFIVIGVGEGLLSSRRLGLILLGVHAAAAVALYLALFARRRYRGGESDIRRKAARAPSSHKGKAAPMPRSLPPIGIVGGAVRAVRSACSSILTICAYTVIFSALTAVAGALGGADFGRIFAAFGEVTNACIGLCKTGNLPLIAAALGFAGMSVIAQVCAAMGDLASLPKTLLFRAINAALSYAICAAVLAVIPQGGVQTAAVAAAHGGGAAFYASADTMALSAVLILSAVLLTASMYFPQNRCIADFF